MQTSKRATWLCAARSAAAATLACAGLAAQASDRPYLATASAAAEEDDDQVWSVETTWQRNGSARAITLAPEYAFNPTTSIQFELARVRDRSAGETTHVAGIEFKHLFNHIARDGYGWGVDVELAFEAPSGQSLRRSGLGLSLPFSLRLGEGVALLHLNAGVFKPREGQREWTGSLALEGEVYRRTTLFAEVARQGNERLAHAGVRYWVTRDKFALDLSALRTRAAGAQTNGVVLGLAWYDLSF